MEAQFSPFTTAHLAARQGFPPPAKPKRALKCSTEQIFKKAHTKPDQKRELEEGELAPQPKRNAPETSFYLLFTKQIIDQLSSTQNKSLTPNLTIRRISITLGCVEREKRKVINDPKMLLDAFFQREAMSLPGMQRLRLLITEIERYNQAPQDVPPTYLIEMHSEIRHLLYYYQCVAFNRMPTTEDIVWRGAKIQIHTGSNYLQAAHHTLIPSIEDDCLLGLKDEFKKQLTQAVSGTIPLQAKTVIQLLSLGVNPNILQGEYSAALKGKSIKEAVETIFYDLKKSQSLIDEDCLFFYINNHTLIAPAPLNILDQILENELRPCAKYYLNEIAAGKMTPHEAAKALSPHYEEIEKDLRALEINMRQLGWVVSTFLATEIGSHTTLEDKIQVIQRYLLPMKQIVEKSIAINATPNHTSIFNTIYENRDRQQPIVSNGDLKDIMGVIDDCEQFLKASKSLPRIEKEINEYQQEINEIRRVSEKRITGIRDIKEKQGALSRYLEAHQSARVKYEEYEKRIKAFQDEENLAQETLKALEDLKNQSQAELRQAKQLVENDYAHQLICNIFKMGEPLRKYQFFHDTSRVLAVLSYVDAQKIGTEKAQKLIQTLPPTYEALQSYLIARNVSITFKKD